jgi:CRP-like cAMP-binding protein
LEAFIARGRRLSLAAGVAFVEPGESHHRLGFIHEGVLRYHLLLRNGEDVTKDFGFPGWFVASFGSAVRKTPARVAVSAVSPCRLTVWPFQALAELMEAPGEWQRFGRRVAEMLYVRKEDSEISLLTHDATERYTALVKMFPSAVRLIPHYHLASYLGIRPQSLSRIRSKLLNDN